MTLKITNDVFLKYITKDCQTLLKKKKVAPVEIKVGNFLHTAEFEDFFIFILFFFEDFFNMETVVYENLIFYT